MQHNLLRAAPIAALALLAACGEQEPEVVGGMYDPDAEAINSMEPVEDMPPMERANVIYRCTDNSVVYVTFFTEDAQASVRTSQDGPRTMLPNPAHAAAAEPADGNETAPAEPAGEPTFTDGSQTLVGTGATVQFNGKSCRSS